MRRRSPWLVWTLAAALALPQGVTAAAQTKPAHGRGGKPATAAAPPPGTNADTGWPRNVTLKSGTVVWYQPQVESWMDQKNIVGWSAVVVHANRGQGAGARHDQDRRPDPRRRRRSCRDAGPPDHRYNFPSLPNRPGKNSSTSAGAAGQRARDRPRSLLADVARARSRSRTWTTSRPTRRRSSPVTTPAILLNLDGETIWSPIKDVTSDTREHELGRLRAHAHEDVVSALQPVMAPGQDDRRPWTPAGKLPESFSKLPPDENWKDVKAAVPATSFPDKRPESSSARRRRVDRSRGHASYLRSRARRRCCG